MEQCLRAKSNQRSQKYLNDCDCQKLRAGEVDFVVYDGDEEDEHVEGPDEVEQLRLGQRVLAQVVRIKVLKRFKLICF